MNEPKAEEPQDLERNYFVRVPMPDLIGHHSSGYWKKITKKRWEKIREKGLFETKVESKP